MSNRFNDNRYTEIREPVTDTDGKPLYYGDVCEFTDPKGNTHVGDIYDAGDDYHTEYYLHESDAKSGWPIERCKDVRLINTDKRWINDPITRVIKVIDTLKQKLIDCGFEVKEHTHGFLVNNKFIVAARQRKWKVEGRDKWYWYGTVESLKKYFT